VLHSLTRSEADEEKMAGRSQCKVVIMHALGIALHALQRPDRFLEPLLRGCDIRTGQAGIPVNLGPGVVERCVLLLCKTIELLVSDSSLPDPAFIATNPAAVQRYRRG